MQFAIWAVIGVLTVVLVSLFARRLGVAAQLILVVIGAGYSLLPGVPDFRPDPDLVLLVLLPPLLYAAAIRVPVVDFRRNFREISALSVVLVVVSAFATGTLLWALLPDLDYAVAVALGAVVSPTDVVAATSIGKRLGLPPRLLTILEGEGLVNDATALVMLRTAVAMSSLTLSNEKVGVVDAVGSFGWAVVAAVAIGLAVGWVTVRLRRVLRDPVLDTTLSFVVPFLAFLPAEEVEASGVIAVVAAGLYSGHSNARFTVQARVSERLNWRTVQFVLEHGVFLLMGLEISALVADVRDDDLSVPHAVVLGLLVTGVLIALRFAFIGPLLLLVRAAARRAERRHEQLRDFLDRFSPVVRDDDRLAQRRDRAERLYERRENDLVQLRDEGIGWRGGLVLGWAGMRGVVTLAAAQTLPEEVPYRPQLVLIAFTVAMATLLLQGATLPFVIRATGVRGSDAVADSRALATLLDEINQAGLAVLDDPTATTEPADPEIVERVRRNTRLHALAAWEAADEGGDSPQRQFRELRREVLRAERDALLDARERGAYPSRILEAAQQRLDLEESRLEQIDPS